MLKKSFKNFFFAVNLHIGLLLPIFQKLFLGRESPESRSQSVYDGSAMKRETDTCLG